LINSDIVAWYAKSVTDTFSNVGSNESVSLTINFNTDYKLLLRFNMLSVIFNKNPFTINLKYILTSEILNVFWFSNSSLADL